MTKVNSITIDTSCFSDNTFINSVDLGNAKWIGNGMTNSFMNCTNLKSVKNINENVDTLKYTFNSCTNLQSMPVLPNSITNMVYAFYNCTSITDVPSLPDSVKDMTYAFSGCSNLVNIPSIPNSVKTLSRTFLGCNSITETPNMSSANNCSNMARAFGNCISLTKCESLPSSITNMSEAFINCYKMASICNIPSSVTNMYSTFRYANMSGDINIFSNQVTNALLCFRNSDKTTKNVYIPFTNMDLTTSATYNSFTSAGYSSTSVVNGVTLYDLNDKIVNTYEPECGSDTTTVLFDVYSDTYTIHNNERIKFKFKLYSAHENNFDCWVLCANNNTTKANLMTVREDVFGWGDYLDTSSLSSTFNFETFKDTVLDGGITYMDVSFYNNKINAKCKIIANDNTEYSYEFKSLELSSDVNSIDLVFSCSNSYMTTLTPQINYYMYDFASGYYTDVVAANNPCYLEPSLAPSKSIIPISSMTLEATDTYYNNGVYYINRYASGRTLGSIKIPTPCLGTLLFTTTYGGCFAIYSNNTRVLFLDSGTTEYTITEADIKLGYIMIRNLATGARTFDSIKYIPSTLYGVRIGE